MIYDPRKTPEEIREREEITNIIWRSVCEANGMAADEPDEEEEDE